MIIWAGADSIGVQNTIWMFGSVSSHCFEELVGHDMSVVMGTFRDVLGSPAVSDCSSLTATGICREPHGDDTNLYPKSFSVERECPCAFEGFVGEHECCCLWTAFGLLLIQSKFP